MLQQQSELRNPLYTSQVIDFLLTMLTVPQPPVQAEASAALSKLVRKDVTVAFQYHPRDYYRYCVQIQDLVGHRPRWSRIFCLPTPQLSMVKTGPYVTPSEASNMIMIQNRTDMPVPRVHDCWLDENTGWWCIWMSCIDGAPLDTLYDTLSEAEKSCLVKQLKHILLQIRAIKSNGKTIAAADGQPSRDQMLQHKQRVYGNELEFRGHLVDGFLDRATDEWVYYKEAEDEVYEVDEIESYDMEVDAISREIGNLKPCDTGSSLVFTHGDFTPRNILIKRTPVDEGGLRVVGILDWSQAGYYPGYWEYVKASCCEQVESMAKATGDIKPNEPGYLKDGIPDRLLDSYQAEAKAYKKAYRKVWGHGID